MLDLLLSKPFPGSAELAAQLPSVRVAEEYGDDDPSVIFARGDEAVPPAAVRRRIPVEARGLDQDGAEIHVLLHVVDGYLWELEIYRPDGEALKRLPEPQSLSILSLDYEDG